MDASGCVKNELGEQPAEMNTPRQLQGCVRYCWSIPHSRVSVGTSVEGCGGTAV